MTTIPCLLPGCQLVEYNDHIVKGLTMAKFAAYLRAARERPGITQSELAGEVGVHKSYISRIERGSSPPPVREKVLAMTVALGVTDPKDRGHFLMAAGYLSTEDYKAAVTQNLDDIN